MPLSLASVWPYLSASWGESDRCRQCLSKGSWKLIWSMSSIRLDLQDSIKVLPIPRTSLPLFLFMELDEKYEKNLILRNIFHMPFDWKNTLFGTNLEKTTVKPLVKTRRAKPRDAVDAPIPRKDSSLEFVPALEGTAPFQTQSFGLSSAHQNLFSLESAESFFKPLESVKLSQSRNPPKLHRWLVQRLPHLRTLARRAQPSLGLETTLIV